MITFKNFKAKGKFVVSHSTFASLGFLGALDGACSTLMEGAHEALVAVRLGVHQFIEAVLVVKLPT